jgi:hypothetical protein
MKPATPESILEAVLHVQDMVTDVQGEQVHPDHLQKAVADGIKAAVSDPEMWAAAMKAMQSKAQTEAGGWLLSGIKAALSKAAWVMAIGLGVYLVGGWSALAALFKSAHN